MKPESAAQHNSASHARKLVENIDHAKNWLDKAKEEFNDSNSVRGELHLSLAQAEVKRAWELSREQCVSTLQELPTATGGRASRKSSLLLPLAAGFGIFLLIAGSVFWIGLQQPGGVAQRPKWVSRATPAPKAGLDSKRAVPLQPMTSPNAVVKAGPVVPVKSSSRITVANPEKQPAVFRRKAPEQNTAVSQPLLGAKRPETVKNDTLVVKDTPVTIQTEVAVKNTVPAETAVAAETPVVKETPAVKEIPSVAAVENPRKNVPVKVEAAAAASSGRIQPALQLPEDDLANIAKRILKSGR